uniref:Rx N-terminal domain-containing protein n=1 Tax=Oryza punctata TaxID=4537 RepID=A0A0E0MHT0_ORYPU
MDAQGALDSLLGRLTSILVSEAQLLGGVRGDVEFIKDEMESMNGLLLHLTDAQYRDHQVRAWMRQIVGLTRDSGHNVELYLYYVGGATWSSRDQAGGRILGYLRRTARFVRTIVVRHRVATRIRELKVRARDVGDRRHRYGVNVPHAPAAYRQNGGRGNADDRPAPRPGGPEEEEDLRRRELLHGEPPAMADTVDRCAGTVIRWLLDGELPSRDGVQDGCPNVICITGQGSVGKTSIATRAYNDSSVEKLFDHKVWINLGTISRGHNYLLQEIKQQLSPVRIWSNKQVLFVLDAAASDVFEGKEIYNSFWDLLRQLYNGDVEYIDDFCRRCAIILTTKYDVGSKDPQPHTSVLRVNKLEYSFSGFFEKRALALSRCEHTPILNVLENCYPDAFALQMFLHLLYANPDRSSSDMVTLSRVLAQHRKNTSRTMLMFCYNDMPIKYKTCLHYLSIFPQGHIIRRTSLIRRWLAERLVTDRLNMSSVFVLDDEAERVFDALVARGFIHPEETSVAGKIKTCTVHPKVHDFIATDVSFMDTSLPLHLAHHFSINSGIALEEASSPSDASPCKSDHAFHGIMSLLHSLPRSDQWQLLKMLDLEGCKGLKKKKHIKNICKILLLKYLSLRDTDVIQLPKKFEKLQCLETLDIRQTEIRAFATKSVFFPMLKHLLAGSKVVSQSSDNKSSHRFKESLETVQLPGGTHRMKSLEMLCHVDASNNVDDLIGIGQLLQLRKLGVIFDGKKASSLALLFKQIEKLHDCLRALSIQINHPATSEGTVPETEQLDALVSPPKLLQSLNISGITSGLPDWITELNQLTKITLSNTYLGEDAIRVLVHN